MVATRTCTVEGCDRPAGGDLCPAHYERLRTTGKIGPATFRRRLSPKMTLREKVETVGWNVSDTGCWIWAGRVTYGRDAGYGRFSHEAKEILAHRAAFMVWCGSIPDGMVVMHTCDTRACINPAHLKLATQADNLRDRDAKRRGNNSRKVQCKWGHPFDAENTIWEIHTTTGRMRRRCKECTLLRGRRAHPHQIASLDR